MWCLALKSPLNSPFPSAFSRDGIEWTSEGRACREALLLGVREGVVESWHVFSPKPRRLNESTTVMGVFLRSFSS